MSNPIDMIRFSLLVLEFSDFMRDGFAWLHIPVMRFFRIFGANGTVPGFATGQAWLFHTSFV